MTVSVLETVLYFVVPSAGLYVLIAVLVAAPWRRRSRYRAGRPWTYPPLWWTADPDGSHLPEPDPQVITGSPGGARDSW